LRGMGLRRVLLSNVLEHVPDRAAVAPAARSWPPSLPAARSTPIRSTPASGPRRPFWRRPSRSRGRCCWRSCPARPTPRT
jgi:hypothetical protein